MPSSKKTPNLLLNKWLGSDKPKKDDFNEDNEILDRSIGALHTRVAQVEQSAEELMSHAQQDFAGQLSQAQSTWGEQLRAAETALVGKVDAVGSDLQAHAGNTVCHVTQQERTAWNQGAVQTGAYTGNGSSSRTVALGFAPKAGVVFAVGRPVVEAIWSSQTCSVFSAMFSASGGSKGASATTTGFTVVNTDANSMGFSYKLNEANETYIYLIWR